MTERQEQIVRCIRKWVADNGEPPTLGEIAVYVGLSSRSSVHYQLKRLEEQGVVVRDERRRRAYRLAN
ncbi:LexA family protein [Streptomyces sp. NPDC059009]|uniref:LexA family protein n=1 Tax=Streptomyces sp. NPDC059009 TaxID=3346694 RepID=UPI0036D1CA5E